MWQMLQQPTPGDYVMVAELRDKQGSFATNTDELFEPIRILN